MCACYLTNVIIYICSTVLRLQDFNFLHGVASSMEIMQKQPPSSTIAFLEKQATYSSGLNSAADIKSAAHILGIGL